MQDGELAQAIVSGDHDGLAEAFDRYATPLYAYCLSLLTGPDAPAMAASAVTDTFVIATVKLAGLTDPGQLQAWLHAVARNECLRQPGAGPAASPAASSAASSGGGPAAGSEPGLDPPAELRGQVMQACTDSTPAGRANRVSVAHRAGPFGRNGFPVVAGTAGDGWWHRVRRHPRMAAGLAAVAVAVVLAGTAWAAIGSTPHRAHPLVALGGGFVTPGASSAPATGQPSSGSRPASSSPAAVSPSAAAAISAADGSSASVSASASRSPAPARSSASPSASPSRSPSPSPSPSVSSSPPPTPGTLRVTPRSLALTAAAGKAVTGTFIVTAVGGPVDFTISSASAKVTVSPSSGSLGAAGAWQTITVTAKSLVAVHTRLVVNPGSITVTVALSIKA